MWAEPLEIGWWSGCSVLLTELLYRLPWSGWIAETLHRFGCLLSALLDAELNEDQREVLLRRSALSLLAQNLKGVALVLSFCAAWACLDALGARWGVNALWSVRGAVVLSVVSLIYTGARLWWTRGRRDRGTLKDGYTYSPLTQGFYSFALDHAPLVRWTFKRERSKAMRRGLHPMADRPVWICGLARAGTTILTELLYDTGLFASLTYRDMPFPLAPRAWRSLSRWSGQRAPERQERAHGDGILVGVDSPEALEEVFWRLHDPSVYQDTHALAAYSPAPDSLKALREYLSCILWSRESGEASELRYLSKNNNHLLRLPALIEAFPEGRFIIPLRDPLSHAESLRRQHLRWIERHERDPFSKRYMDWLAHHEFGSGHRRFSWDDLEQSSPEDERALGQHESKDEPHAQDPHHINYWLTRWIEAYRSVQRLDLDRVLIIDYAHLNARPQEALTELFHYLDVNIGHDTITSLAQRLKPAQRTIDDREVSEALRAEASRLYESLCIKNNVI